MPVNLKNLAAWAAININVKMNFKSHVAWLFYFIDEETEAPDHRTSLIKYSYINDI